jgi:hypothetical protein
MHPGREMASAANKNGQTSLALWSRINLENFAVIRAYGEGQGKSDARLKRSSISGRRRLQPIGLDIKPAAPN